MREKEQLFYYEQWLNFKSDVRDTMRRMGLLEVETPYFVDGPAFEEHLEPFSTVFYHGSRQKTYYLPTSPEIHLKKLMAMGFQEIFEIKSCFRNGELSPHHEPEFTMLEWYRTGAQLSDIKNDVKALIEYLGNRGWWCRTEQPPTWQELSYAELISKNTGFNLTPTSTLAEVSGLARSLGLHPDGSESVNELLDWIFVHKIEPSFKIEKNSWVFVHSYPIGSLSLAQANKEGWSDRFELYMEGVELANAFCELVDYEEHEKRWKQIGLNRKKRGLPNLGRDEDFFSLIKKGLPRCSGIALGMERLFMAFTGLNAIKEFKLFSKSE